jgi:GT2 family glycosyltransferase
MSQPSVSIIIANYNGEKYLERCLESLERTEYPEYDLVIVDDGSTDTSVEIIQRYISHNSKIKLIMNEKNYGASASRNRAIDLVTGEVIVFLDNDTEVTPSWLNCMIETLYSSDQVGAVQAVLMDFEKRDQIQNAGVLLWAQTGWGLPDFQWSENSGKMEKSPIIAISACMAVKKEVLLIVGGFDQKEAVTTEDLDLSWRIWIAGFTILRASDAVVYHWTKSIDMRRSMNASAEKIYFHLTKNSLTSILKNYEIRNAIWFSLYSLCISLGRGVLSLVKRYDFSALRGSVRGFIWTTQNLRYILNERKKIQLTRKVSDRELFQTVLRKGSVGEIYVKYFTKSELL